MDDDTHGLGYRRVDGDPNVDVLLRAMDATAQWEATRRLRAWERERVRLASSQRLLDVGCGLGDAALALGSDLAADGEVVGVDLSEAMVRAATARAVGVTYRTRFAVGDAMALAEPDGAFDAVRSERTLQWLPDPAAAVRDLVRVTRTGGWVSLIDTDWSSFAIDVGDDDLAARVRETMRVERRRPSHVGRRLGGLLHDAGCVGVVSTAATQTWTVWNPDDEPAPPGCFSMRSLADDVAEAGHLAPHDVDSFVAAVHDAARQGRFSMRLTMHAAAATKPVHAPDGSSHDADLR